MLRRSGVPITTTDDATFSGKGGVFHFVMERMIEAAEEKMPPQSLYRLLKETADARTVPRTPVAVG